VPPVGGIWGQRALLLTQRLACAFVLVVLLTVEAGGVAAVVAERDFEGEEVRRVVHQRRVEPAPDADPVLVETQRQKGLAFGVVPLGFAFYDDLPRLRERDLFTVLVEATMNLDGFPAQQPLAGYAEGSG
jgi:hypothetical protein